jgi:hypothetical protein
MNLLKKIRLSAILAIFLGILTTASLTSCGKQGGSEAEDTEQAEDAEHPEDNAEEHPADSAEHPTDSTEHPSDTTATQ